VTNENFRRELGQVFDDMAGTPSAALSDRVRSSVAQAPEQRGPFWIAGVAAAVIAVVLIGVLVVANPLGRHNTVVPGVGASPTPSASAQPSQSPSATVPPDSTLPAFTCNAGTFNAKPTTPASPPVAFVDAVRLGTHSGYDRITIEFNNGIPNKVDVVPQNDAKFTQGASGQQVVLAGSAGILITMQVADEHTAYTGSIDFKTGYPVLVEARQVQDFEGTVQWALGISKSACYRAFFLAGPSRLVIDVQA
jgi:hypothetical protein